MKRNNLNNRSGVYALMNITSDKMYIGATKNLGKRCSSHTRELRAKCHRCSLLQEDYNSGEEFCFAVLEWCDKDDIFKREQFHIKYYMSQNSSLYNVVGKSDGSSSIPVNKICLATGEILDRYKSQTEAAKSLGIAKSNISEVILGKQKTAGGFLWERA